MSFTLSFSSAVRPEAVSIPAPPAAGLTKHFVALDGLRGIAILMVVAIHYSDILGQTGGEVLVRRLVVPGYLGVNLFFVLSGFLITRILVQTRDHPSYFRTFYLRRSLRIFPLYYAYLAFIILGYNVFSHWRVGLTYQLDSHFLWYLGYASNIRWIRLNDMGLLHLWSLAIEEQFYLVWPFVLYYTPRRWWLPICALGCFGSLGCRVAMNLAHCDFRTIYTFTPGRMDALFIGGAVGIIELNEVARQRLIRAIQPVILGSLLLIALLVAQYGLLPEVEAVNTWGWSVLAVLFAMVVFWAATTGAHNRLLCASWLRTLGKYSYGIYMLHGLAQITIPRHMPADTIPQRVLILGTCLAATAMLTALSWHLVERPFLRRKPQLVVAAA